MNRDEEKYNLSHVSDDLLVDKELETLLLLEILLLSNTHIQLITSTKTAATF